MVDQDQERVLMLDSMLEDMDIAYEIIDRETTMVAANAMMDRFRPILEQGKDVAFVVKKGALSFEESVEYRNDNALNREDVIRRIAAIAKDAPIVSTTGKISRELFEIREANAQSHKYDFLTVGSMGHASMIALGMAVDKPDRRIWCLDGDGALLMHLGALQLIAERQPSNLVHVIINN